MSDIWDFPYVRHRGRWGKLNGMQIIDGRKLGKEILFEVKNEVAKFGFKPVFCDVLVGDDPASIQYVKMKAKTAETVGIRFHKANFPVSITTGELLEEIKKLNKIPNMCGIIIQLPLPEHIDRQAALDGIDPRLDVDCLGRAASAKFYEGGTELGFPTALACMALLDSLNLDLRDKKIAVLGQGLLVGKPVSALLKFRGLTPTIITSKTEYKEEIIKETDIIISGIGKGKYLTGDMIKKGAVIIDAGTSEAGNGPADGGVKIVGDVDSESVKNVAGFLSPVPGGVGPVTVAMLLSNVLTVAKKKSNE
ncbi:TPA: bifunctional 5,10-methylene-tetrahydrofolate dehydrogenase/5,10-methylene-tetrahydrofolate cyclohydrolase [Candidatus Nomurabacteria bacterium]|uniref:Bifunctional protein FolD n=2 Tax=Candidatus Nomuraibacteriota TaxID=1752729 RepID=A0A0G1EMU7_9BACT|nr:MAG: Bifunctional protein FolD [Parcubacteria group bacterium GW2011_GWC1_42_21]KKS57673.1 MAG: Bifunctional protein FolD [Candidatus Nomurabacteria bacterium GW2011_GWF1_42_40]KKS99833.1 MAG: Bifunctional protein FolD [Candidatus Nomurabacteria bacterium GW2011_GWA1_43_17]KKT07494.1 MAG: Bifunctional protein FolD [Candidatus Nomurabacteria bacterium GW2011_GWB1_43_19]KKT11305.1 MAG: Bifunctional protein FolD [Candidatus Nomurabacteria bacterium GW2011_GWF2_43_24]KKT17883.1 MAG: Bifunctiona